MSNLTEKNAAGCEYDILEARIPGQLSLFPLSPQKKCEQIGLNWWSVIKLYNDGLISFNPETVDELDEGQEAELSFLAALITSGVNDTFLLHILAGLKQPYQFNAGSIYYDWLQKRWRPLPETPEPEDVFNTWLEELKENSDTATLERLERKIREGLGEISYEKPL